ncbi:MAG: hypothetical protein Q8Q49_05285 [bacterium]|nr:hypothetical protein [bacterium]
MADNIETRSGTVDPSQFKAVRGVATDSLAQQVEGLASELRGLAIDTGNFLVDHPIVTSAGISIREPEGIEGTLVFAREPQSTEIHICFEGNRSELLEAPKGTPYTAKWDGKFHRRPNPTKAPYSQDGDQITQGHKVGWAVVTKNSQWAVVHEGPSGVIRFPLEDTPLGAEVKNGETVIYYVNERK